MQSIALRRPLPRLHTLARLGGLALAALTLAPAAHAGTTTTYDNRTAWTAATPGTVNRDFNELPGGAQTRLADGYTNQGVTFTTTNRYLWSWSGPQIDTDGSWIIGPWSNGSMTLGFAAGTAAVGFDLGVANGLPGSIQVSVDLLAGNDFSTTLSTSVGQHVFFGLDTPGDNIRAITFHSNNIDPIVIDNLATLTSAVPEPASMALWLAALGPLGLIARRQRRGGR